MNRDNVYQLAQYRSRRQALAVIEQARSRVAGETPTRPDRPLSTAPSPAVVIAFPQPVALLRSSED